MKLLARDGKEPGALYCGQRVAQTNPASGEESWIFHLRKLVMPIARNDSATGSLLSNARVGSLRCK